MLHFSKGAFCNAAFWKEAFCSVPLLKWVFLQCRIFWWNDFHAGRGVEYLTTSRGRRIAVSCEMLWCRCRDPRELGSCCSALLCSGCGGVVLPLDPLGRCSHLPHIFCKMHTIAHNPLALYWHLLEWLQDFNSVLQNTTLIVTASGSLFYCMLLLRNLWEGEEGDQGLMKVLR